MNCFSHGHHDLGNCLWGCMHDDDVDDDDVHDNSVVQHSGHTPANRLTEACSLGLQYTSLILVIHVMVN